MTEKKYQYSEIFGNTIQGEGQYTGVPTVWVRFWGCNLECNGFGQTNPTDKSTWILDYQTVDISSIKTMEELPVFNRGCDSSYSWSKNYAHLAHTATAAEICDKLEGYLKSVHNPEGKFLHPKSKQWTHMAFTGGEPMMSQNAMADVMAEFERRGNVPKFVTVETNGTQRPRDKISDCVKHFTSLGTEWFWSVSPKLYLSGEQWEDTIKPEILKAYWELSPHGQLKYVSNGEDRSWDEVETATTLYREVGINCDVHIMPVGATVAGQELVAAKVTEEAVARGYRVAARVHAYIFANVIGK